jgi:hypothetical protein
MSPINPKKWVVPCACCQKGSVEIFEWRKREAGLFVCFIYRQGNYVEHMGWRSGERLFLVICPSCVDQIADSPNIGIATFQCASCFRPLLVTVDSRTGEPEILGAEADLELVGDKVHALNLLCNSCGILTHK